MKKEAAALVLSLALLTAGPVSAMAADGDTTQTGHHAETGEKLKTSFVDSGNLVSIKHWDLDTIIKRAIDNSYNLSLLNMKLTALKQNESNLKDQKKELDKAKMDTGSGSYSLPTNPDEIMKKYFPPDQMPTEPPLWLGPVIETNTVVNQVMNGVGGIASALNKQLQSQREQLEQGLEKLNTEQSNTLLDLEMAKDGAELQITSQYVQLLSLDKQIELAEQYLELLKRDEHKASVLQEEGLASSETVMNAQRAISDQEEQLESLRANYQLALIQMCFDLGIVYDPEIALEDIEYTPQPVTRKDTEALLENSYDMKKQWNAIVQAKNEEYGTDAANDHQEDYLNTMTRISEQQAEQTRVELSKKISKTYSDADTAYRAYRTAEKDLAEANQDYTHMEARFNNGLVSHYDFYKYGFTLTQQELARDLTRLQVYMANKAAHKMEEGLIN
ncbi:TolC family protein [Paenibacillus sanfengchensis]|uniref:TolC family protein n=1 Tax=Paenibacillus sanfengchensis TaxID=3119819 RepID=UPI002FE1B598